MNLTLDTYAWIEYFEGSEQGEKAKEFIENPENSLITPSVVLAELSDAVIKGKVKIDWEDLVKFIVFNSQIEQIDQTVAKEAGLIKNTLRKKHPSIGLIDGIVLATARKMKSKLLTGDSHMTDEDDVIDMKRF